MPDNINDKSESDIEIGGTPTMGRVPAYIHASISIDVSEDEDMKCQTTFIPKQCWCV